MDSQVAKIYKQGVLTQELEEKLTLMIEYPPSDMVMSQVAWPLDVIYDSNGQACGFIMPKLSINAELVP
jgi:DNA-binding helix-hairpin-helix protein with protein kinase domain